jgi:ATP-dependent helicase/DNAse subunit B
MKSLVKELHSICTNHPYQEKIIIVDQHTIGEQIMEAYTMQGFAAIHIKYKTVLDLAMDLLESQSIIVNQVIDRTIGSQITFHILTQLKEKGQFTYFHEIEITSSFSGSIFEMIHTLRTAGYTSHTLNQEYFLTKEKGQDIIRLLADYETYLHTNKLKDTADLFHLAIEYRKTNEKLLYILQSNLSITYVEETFLSKILSERTKKLPLQQVKGIKIPNRSSIRSILWGESTSLSYLYENENAKEPVNLSLFTAKTEEIEIKNILTEIKTNQSKLDGNIIFYTNGEKYITLFYHLAQKEEIPVTFGEGIPILFSRPGRLASGILHWMKSNYRITAFFDLLHEGLLDLGEEAPSKTRITNILREAEIGWGKDRYLVQLERLIQKLLKKKRKTDNPDRVQYYENQIHQVSWLMNWFKALLKKLPTIKDQMGYKESLTGMAFIIKNYCRSSAKMDEVSKVALLDEIEKVLPFSNETYSRFYLFDKIEDLLLSLRVLHSNPKPGHLHISSYKNGIYNSRPNIHIVGLDNRKFPGGSSEDPLLLDMERGRLGNSLPFLKESGHEKLYTMLQLLAESEGNITLSYCNFDVFENRVVSPSYLFLQGYRLMTDNTDADFKEIQRLPSFLEPTEIVDQKDFWNQKLLNHFPLKVNKDLFNPFPNLLFGLEAEKSRAIAQFSEYDGFVPIDPAIFDPRQNKERVMTASKLETLAACPYSYFLGEVLGVQPIEEMEMDLYTWLDPATRGSLLHKVFETYYLELQNATCEMTPKDQDERITRIAMELINEQKELLPPPNERVFQMEVKDILDCCRIFLKEEEKHCQTYKPTYFEYTFGSGENEPAELTLPSGENIRLSGKIDRVDETSLGKFHIIDYKTGSTYGYRKNHVYKGGRQLQHFIYALAIEQHLQLASGSVEESAYYFPTAKGLGERFIRNQNATVRTNGLDILERLIDVIANGHFTMTDDQNDCNFCQLKNICRRNFYEKEILEGKLSDKNFEALRRFKGVRAYD